jgi:hypothetical protein
MKYHNLLLNLFSPLLTDGLDARDEAKFVAVVQQTPVQAVTCARARLETLFRIYYLRHSFDAMDAYLLHYLNTLGFMSMEELAVITAEEPSRAAEDKRCLMLMCALGLREQGQYYYLVRTIFHLFRSKLGRHEAELLRHYIQDRNPEKDELYRPEDLVSDYPLNILDLSDNPETHRVTNLVKEADGLSAGADVERRNFC